MVVLDKTIVVHASPERVWRVLVTRLAVPARAPDGVADAAASAATAASAASAAWPPAWAPGVVRAEALDGACDVRAGTAFATVREDLGLSLVSVQEAVAADPPRRFAWRQRAGDFARHDGWYELSPAAGGTRVHLRVAVELPFVLPRLVTEEAIRAHYSSRFDAALLTLKAAVEADPEA